MENKTQSKTYPKPKYDGFYNKVVKRIIGLLIAGIALLILWPFYLIIALAIAIVFRGIPYWIGLVVIPSVLLFADRKALLAVDYPLLLTFVFFFIFAGNMGRIDAVRAFFSGLLEKSTLLVSVISCQVISNVPTAVLLSQFTNNYTELLIGVNIGGVGTLIASLASLITFREYVKNNPGKTMNYVGKYTLFNFGFLILLVGFMLLMMAIR